MVGTAFVYEQWSLVVADGDADCFISRAFVQYPPQWIVYTDQYLF